MEGRSKFPSNFNSIDGPSEGCLFQEYYTADTFISPLNLYGRNSASLATLHPAAFFAESLDLMGRAHALQSRSVDVQDPRAMETRKDATSAIVSAATRWYMDIGPAIGRFDDKGPISALNLLTVSASRTVRLLHGALIISTILYSTAYIMRQWNSQPRLQLTLTVFSFLPISTILKLQSFHAYPALATNSSIVEPYASACLAAARAITILSCRATESFDASTPSVSPIFIWCCWIAARVMFGK